MNIYNNLNKHQKFKINKYNKEAHKIIKIKLKNLKKKIYRIKIKNYLNKKQIYYKGEDHLNQH